MTQYFETHAQLLESLASKVSGYGEHELAGQLWALATKYGTRVPDDPMEPAMATDSAGYKWFTDGDGMWWIDDVKISWDAVTEVCVPPLRIEYL